MGRGFRGWPRFSTAAWFCLNGLARARGPSKNLAVLAYHEVSCGTVFARQLDWLRKFRNPVSLAQVVESANDGVALPAGSVLITFDDGDRSVLDVAAPLLAERGLPAVAFVVSSLIGTTTPFWWRVVEAKTPVDEVHGVLRWLKSVPDSERRAWVREHEDGLKQHNLSAKDCRALREMGVEVENHTMTHPLLDRCAPATVLSEITAAHSRLEEVLGHPPSVFAYPNGNTDERAIPILRRLGYSLAFQFDHRLQPWPPKRRFHASRIRVDADDPIEKFGPKASGVHSLVHHLRGRG